MVSVIIPVYNVGQLLQTMLECVSNQVYSDFEVILVDDGSTDGSSLICDQMAAKDNRFHVIHQNNSGAAAARNKGIQMASGEFITFLDADDEIPQNYLEVLSGLQQMTNADVTVCDVVVLENGIEKHRFTKGDTVINRIEALNEVLSRKGINSGPCAKLIRKSIIGNIQFPPLKAYEDIVFVKNVFHKARIVAATSKTEYKYIQNADSAMHQFVKEPSMDLITATRELVDFIEQEQGLSPDCLYITMSHLFQYVQSLNGNRSDKARLFIQYASVLFRQKLASILRCKAFPWKEKVLFALFAVGVKC